MNFNRTVFLTTLWIWATIPALSNEAVAQEPESVGSASGENRISLGLVTIRVDNKTFLNSLNYIDSAVDGLTRSDGYAVLPPAEAKARLDRALFANTVFRTAVLREIEKSITEGEELLYTNPSKAIEVLKAANATLVKAIDRSSLTEALRAPLFRIKMLLARSLFDNGSEKAAGKVLAETVALFGDEPLNTDVYHPQIVALHNKARQASAKEEKGGLSLTSEPAGAQVIINGEKRGGVTPVELTGISPGEHHIQFITPNEKSRVHRVEVRGGEVSKLNVSLGCDAALSWASDGPAFFFENTTELTDGVRSYSAQVAGYLGVDYVLAIGLVPHKKGAAFIGYLVEVNTGRLLQSETILVNPDVVDEAAIGRMISGLSGKQDEGGYEVKKDYFGTQGPWYKQWPGWVLTGAGVVSTILAISYYSEYNTNKANAENPDFRITDSDTGNAARESAANQALKSQRAAWATGVIGVLSLGGAATFFTMHHLHQQAQPSQSGTYDGASWSLIPALSPGQVQIGFGAAF